MKNATADQSNSPYPFTAEELWQRFKEVSPMPGNDLTRENIEKIFKIKFQAPVKPETKSVFDPSYISILRADKNWDYRFHLFVEGGIIGFGYSFQPFDKNGPQPEYVLLPNELPGELCMNADLARKDIIENMGWKATLPRPNPQFSGKPGARLIETPPPPLVPENEYSFFRKAQDGAEGSLILNFDFHPSRCVTKVQIIVTINNGH